MDTLAHGLYGAALVARTRDERLMVAAGFFGMLPDLIPYGMALTNTSLPKWMDLAVNSNPVVPDFFIKSYYLAHSFVPILIVAVALFLFKRKWLILLIPYALHVAFDIPFHCSVFSTRFFYPLSDFHICGYSYADNLWVWEVNYGILVGIYYLIYTKFYKPHLR